MQGPAGNTRTSAQTPKLEPTPDAVPGKWHSPSANMKEVLSGVESTELAPQDTSSLIDELKKSYQARDQDVDRLVHENRELEKTLQERATRITNLEKTNKNLRAANKDVESRIESVSKQLNASRSTHSATRDQLENLHKHHDEAISTIKYLQATLLTQQQQSAELKQNVQNTANQLAEAEATILSNRELYEQAITTGSTQFDTERCQYQKTITMNHEQSEATKLKLQAQIHELVVEAARDTYKRERLQRELNWLENMEIRRLMAKDKITKEAANDVYERERLTREVTGLKKEKIDRILADSRQ